MTKTFAVLSPRGTSLRLQFDTFEQAAAAVVAGYEIVGEFDGSTSKPGEFPDSPPVWGGGVLVAEISRSDLKNPLSPYLRTSVAKERPAHHDADLIAFIQDEIDAGRLRTRRQKGASQ